MKVPDAYVTAAYEYLRTLGNPGDKVHANMEKFLQDTFDVPDKELIPTRTAISHELQKRGLVYKEKDRSRYMTLLPADDRHAPRRP